MLIAVRYYSRSGNTEKVAEAIALAAGCRAETCAKPVAEPTDLLFLGGAVYAGGIDDALRGFIRDLNPQLVKRIAIFSTTAIKTSAYPELKRLLEARGIQVLVKEFHCRGKFTALHRSRPNEEDLSNAASFAKECMKQVIVND